MPSATTPVVGLATALDRVVLIIDGSAPNTIVGMSARTTCPGPGLTVTVIVFVSEVVVAIVAVVWPAPSVGLFVRPADFFCSSIIPSPLTQKLRTGHDRLHHGVKFVLRRGQTILHQQNRCIVG